MVAPSSNLQGIRETLLAMFAAAAPGLGSPRITYQALPQGGPVAADVPIVRALVNLPSRALVGGGGGPCVQQNGTLVLQWLFARPVQTVVVTAALEGTVAIYRQRVLTNGVILTGDAQAVRVGVDVETGRVRWDVIVPWKTELAEAGAGHTTPRLGLNLPTIGNALLTVRNLWLTRIEQPVVAESWAGLKTYYDDVPTFQTPPPLPWAGYWCDTITNTSPETQSGTERVLGRALVQMHTDKSLGTAGSLANTERIVAEHNRIASGVRFGIVHTERQTVSGAGTLQTNIRVPFSFERLRAS